MTTWKGREFEREWHRAMMEWIDGGRVGEVPAWEVSGTDAEWLGVSNVRIPRFSANDFYRWAPKPKRTVTINGKTLVAPEVVAPANEVIYWFFNRSSDTEHIEWNSDEFDKQQLDTGNVFLTREDAQAMADWLVKCRRGET